MKYRSALSPIIAALALLGCSGNAGPDTNPALAARLRKAPTSVQVGEATLTLSAALWRDFEPPAQPGGSPLIGSFTISTQNPAIYPQVTFDALWVVNGTMVWSATLENNPLADPAPGMILKMARNVPKWTPGTTGDVIAQVGLTDGSSRLIRVAGVLILSAN